MSTPPAGGSGDPGWGSEQPPPGQQPPPAGQPGWGGGPPPVPGQGYAPPYGYAPAAREHAPGAVGSLVCGILGLFTIPLVLSIVAVVLGSQSKRAAAAEPQRYNDQLGAVGRILGWIGIGLAAFGILLLVAAFALFFPLRAS